MKKLKIIILSIIALVSISGQLTVVQAVSPFDTSAKESNQKHTVKTGDYDYSLYFDKYWDLNIDPLNSSKEGYSHNMAKNFNSKYPYFKLNKELCIFNPETKYLMFKINPHCLLRYGEYQPDHTLRRLVSFLNDKYKITDPIYSDFNECIYDNTEFGVFYEIRKTNNIENNRGKSDRKRNNECKTKFETKYPDFKPDNSKCNTENIHIFSMHYYTNPNCINIDINTIPLELNYYYTSWGVFKVGEYPDTTKPKIVTQDPKTALANDDPDKPEGTTNSLEEGPKKPPIPEKKDPEKEKQKALEAKAKKDKAAEEIYQKFIEERSMLDNQPWPQRSLRTVTTFFGSLYKWFRNLSAVGYTILFFVICFLIISSYLSLSLINKFKKKKSVIKN
jgi:hypothetical protein